MYQQIKNKFEVSPAYKKRLKTLLFEAFGEIPEQTSYSSAGRALGLSHSSIKAWVGGSLKWEIHPTSVEKLAQILRKSGKDLEVYLRYGRDRQQASDSFRYKPSLLEIEESLRTKTYWQTEEDRLTLLKIVATANNLLIQQELLVADNDIGFSGRSILPFVAIDKLTNYLQAKLDPEDYEAFYAECPLINDRLAELVSAILEAKSKTLSLEDVKDALPAIAAGLSNFSAEGEVVEANLAKLKELI